MAFYYNGRGRNKILTVKRVVGNTEEILNGSGAIEGFTNIPNSITAEFTAPDGTVYTSISDDQFAKLSSEQYMRRLVDFVSYIKAQLAAKGEHSFANVNLTAGAEVMTGIVGPVPEVSTP